MSKKISHKFAQKTSFTWWTSTSTSVAMKIICYHNIAKTLFTLKIFQETCFYLASENFFAEMVQHDMFTPKNCNKSWNTLKTNVYIFLYIYVINFLFQRSSKIWWDGELVFGGWINLLRRIAVWASWNKIYFFILIEIYHFRCVIY